MLDRCVELCCLKLALELWAYFIFLTVLPNQKANLSSYKQTMYLDSAGQISPWMENQN